MLKLFEVSGFKNFLSPIRIDFSDVKNYQFNENCICNNLLQKLIVYGKNASGKSNLGLALFDIVSHMTTNNVIPGLYSFYLNSESKLEFAEFRYVFVFTPYQIDYLYRKNGNQDLVYERVILNDDLLFEYNYAEKQGTLSGLEKLIPDSQPELQRQRFTAQICHHKLCFARQSSSLSDDVFYFSHALVSFSRRKLLHWL